MTHPAQIAVVKRPQVRDAVFEHRDPLKPHPKGKSLIFIGVDTAIFKHARGLTIPLPRISSQSSPAPILSPPPSRVHPISTSADGFSKREIRWPETYRQIINTKERPAEINQAALEMPHMNILADHQTFALVKHGRMGGIMVGTIGPPGRNNADWRLDGFHGADLYR